MDEKSLRTLEFDKIQARLAEHTDFSASHEQALTWQPVNDLETARRLQAETREARALLDSDMPVSVGGARDVRPLAEAAARGKVLTPAELLDVKATLVAARTLKRAMERQAAAFPHLADWAAQIPPPMGLVDAISQAISERGEVLDAASEALARIRRELRTVHQRLLDRLQRMVNDPRIASMLQDAIVTQRDGRYVIPLRAEFKGRLKAVVHDRSASGATLFVEPLAVVEANNRYRELQLAEQEEERRVLAALSQQVGAHTDALVRTVDALAAIDLILARARLAAAMDAVEPELLPWRTPKGKTRHPGSTIRLFDARHPLLDPETVVPIDVELFPQNYVVVITGPNTGGKTVTLKTVGLLALMAQAGLHIPARKGSQLSVFDDVFADIGDEQSIEQSLSTFSGHITNIIRILERADRRSLVIFDELGAGTDPQEGAALARAILHHLVERGITTFVATHYPELKAYAHATPGVVNASVEFDLETLRPTYRLTIGIPGRSNALAIATRLGLPSEIVEAARGTLNPADVQADDLLDAIHRERERARQARAEAERLRQEAEQLRAELAERLDRIEEERRAVLEAARTEAREEIARLEAEIEAVRAELRRARQPVEALRALEEQVEALEEAVAPPPAYRPPDVVAAPQTLRVGSRRRPRNPVPSTTLRLRSQRGG